MSLIGMPSSSRLPPELGWLNNGNNGHSTYLSENALLPTHADTHFGKDEARNVYAFNRNYHSLLAKLATDRLTPQEASMCVCLSFCHHRHRHRHHRHHLRSSLLSSALSGGWLGGLAKTWKASAVACTSSATVRSLIPVGPVPIPSSRMLSGLAISLND